MEIQLTGKRAVVTGGSRGLGLVIGRALASEVCEVALVARDQRRGRPHLLLDGVVTRSMRTLTIPV